VRGRIPHYADERPLAGDIELARRILDERRAGDF